MRLPVLPGAHAVGAKNFGVSDEKLANVWTYAASAYYSERQRLALDFALAAASQPNAVTDEQFAQLRQHWSDGEITEILGVVAMFAFVNRWNDTMGAPLEASCERGGRKSAGRAGMDTRQARKALTAMRRRPACSANRSG